MWAYFSNTLVFGFRKPERNDMCIMFWDTSINEKHVKYMKRLQKIAAFDEYCVLIAKLEDETEQWTIVLCNSVGCPIESKTINIEPKFVAMNKTHVIVASDEIVYYWQYRAQNAKMVEKDKKQKAGKENAFHIESTPKEDTIYDHEKWVKPAMTTNDPISAIAAGPTSFIVGRQSGLVFKYSLPYIQFETKLKLRCKP
jgi:WD repeat-containing protein 35